MIKKKQGAKVTKVKINKITPLAEDKQKLEAEIELHSDALPKVEYLPLEITPDAVEPEKKSFWNFLFGGK